MKEGIVTCHGHSYVFRSGDFVYKIYKQKPELRDMFPNVHLEDLAEYECRVCETIRSFEEDFVPEVFESVSAEELLVGVSECCMNADCRKKLTQRLKLYPNIPGIKKTHIDGADRSLDGGMAVNLAIQRIQQIGFDPKDVNQNGGLYLNVIVTPSGPKFHDFKSFKPDSLRGCKAVYDLINHLG